MDHPLFTEIIIRTIPVFDQRNHSEDHPLFVNRDHNMDHLGAQWLSSRVLDSRPKGRGFDPHRRHRVVVLEQDTFILA